ADRIQVQALVVQNYVDAHSHHAATRSLGEWLRSENIPAVTGIDTRTLTRRLRESGTMRGWLFPKNLDTERAKSSCETVEMREEVFRLVAPKETIRYPGGQLRIML